MHKIRKYGYCVKTVPHYKWGAICHCSTWQIILSCGEIWLQMKIFAPKIMSAASATNIMYGYHILLLHLAYVIADARPEVDTGWGPIDLVAFHRAADIVPLLVLALVELVLFRFVGEDFHFRLLANHQIRVFSNRLWFLLAGGVFAWLVNSHLGSLSSQQKRGSTTSTG